MSSGKCGQRRPRSACASAQADQGLRCPEIDSVDTIECVNGEQIRCNFAHAQDNVNPHILHTLDGAFSIDAAHLILDPNNH